MQENYSPASNRVAKPATRMRQNKNSLSRPQKVQDFGLSENHDKYRELPLPEPIHLHHPSESLSMRWGDETVVGRSETATMMDAVKDSAVGDSTVAGVSTVNGQVSPNFFAWHPRNEFADLGAHGKGNFFNLNSTSCNKSTVLRLDPTVSAGASINENSELDLGYHVTLTEQGEKFQWWPIEKVTIINLVRTK